MMCESAPTIDCDDVVTVKIFKPSRDAPLGLTLGGGHDRDDGSGEEILVTNITPGSLCSRTPLTTGMVLVSINDLTFPTCAGAIQFLRGTFGTITVVARKEQEHANHDAQSQTATVPPVVYRPSTTTSRDTTTDKPLCDDVEQNNHSFSSLDKAADEDNLKKPKPEQQPHPMMHRRRCLIWTVVGLMIVLGIIGIIAGIIFGADDNHDAIYNVDIHWQAMGIGWGGDYFLEWGNPTPISLHKGESTLVSNGEIEVELQDVNDEDKADLKVSVTVECCTRTWDDVTATVDSHSWGSWSHVQSCNCHDAIFDHQVRAKVSRSNERPAKDYDDSDDKQEEKEWQENVNEEEEDSESDAAIDDEIRDIIGT